VSKKAATMNAIVRAQLNFFISSSSFYPPGEAPIARPEAQFLLKENIFWPNVVNTTEWVGPVIEFAQGIFLSVSLALRHEVLLSKGSASQGFVIHEGIEETYHLK
jgi:hypothetical protein